MKNNYVYVLQSLVATLLYIVINELIGTWWRITELIKFEDFYKYYLLIQGILQTFAVILFIYIINKKTLKSIVKSTKHKWYFIAAALGVFFVFFQAPLNYFYNLLFDANYHTLYRLSSLTNLQNVNLISSILLIPIGEELFFRRFIQNRLQKKVNFLISLTVASMLFATIHSPYMTLFIDDLNQNWHIFYLTFFGGIFSGLIYYFSKSIGPSIIFHIFWNLTATLV